jgi:plasmid stabilization system protein ParE
MGTKKKGIAEGYPVRVTEKAEKDVNEIVGFISDKRKQTLNGLRVADALERKFVRIGRNPWAFKECEEIPTTSKMYRRAACYSWSIVYRISHAEVIILGVIHQSSKPSRTRELRKIK